MLLKASQLRRPCTAPIATSSGLWGEALRDHVRGKNSGTCSESGFLPTAPRRGELDLAGPGAKDYFGRSGAPHHI